MIGEEASKYRSVLDVKYPMENGIVRDWKDMQLLWDYTFHDKLDLETKDCRILLTEPPLNPSANKKQMFGETSAKTKGEEKDQAHSNLHSCNELLQVKIERHEEKIHALEEENKLIKD